MQHCCANSWKQNFEEIVWYCSFCFLTQIRFTLHCATGKGNRPKKKKMSEHLWFFLKGFACRLWVMDLQNNSLIFCDTTKQTQNAKADETNQWKELRQKLYRTTIHTGGKKSFQFFQNPCELVCCYYCSSLLLLLLQDCWEPSSLSYTHTHTHTHTHTLKVSHYLLTCFKQC